MGMVPKCDAPMRKKRKNCSSPSAMSDCLVWVPLPKLNCNDKNGKFHVSCFLKTFQRMSSTSLSVSFISSRALSCLVLDSESQFEVQDFRTRITLKILVLVALFIFEFRRIKQKLAIVNLCIAYRIAFLFSGFFSHSERSAIPGKKNTFSYVLQCWYSCISFKKCFTRYRQKLIQTLDLH